MSAYLLRILLVLGFLVGCVTAMQDNAPRVQRAMLEAHQSIR